MFSASILLTHTLCTSCRSSVLFQRLPNLRFPDKTLSFLFRRSSLIWTENVVSHFLLLFQGCFSKVWHDWVSGHERKLDEIQERFSWKCLWSNEKGNNLKMTKRNLYLLSWIQNLILSFEWKKAIYWSWTRFQLHHLMASGHLQVCLKEWSSSSESNVCVFLSLRKRKGWWFSWWCWSSHNVCWRHEREP